MTTRRVLRHAIDAQLRLIHGSPTATRTATGGTVSTLVDSARSEADDYWSNSWLFIATTTDGLAPVGQEALVTDFAAVSRTLTFIPAMSATVHSGDTYELRRYFSAIGIHEAINAAIDETQSFFPPITMDESLVIRTGISEYPLPAIVHDILRIDILEHPVRVHGTATSGTVSTLADTSRTWATNQWAAHEVAIFDGVGAGQFRTIQSNTATVLTVTLDWTVAPASTSRYVIKDVANTPNLQRLTWARHVGDSLILEQDLIDGQRLRVTHAPQSIELTSDIHVTSIPKVLVVDRAMYRLLSLAPVILPGDDMARRTNTLAQEYWQRSEHFIRRHGGRKPAGTWWNRGPSLRATPWAPGGRSIGTRKG